ncbi:P-loop containing nucleoside triphosphate hydrolase protein [Dipodascopsis tothii]|uniref:P-loop containing nucleoside triphosphate hydrolase protein n=1 Tax=Dipodascopsis tothii TaxID=44089 RepID=UPI0034CFB872
MLDVKVEALMQALLESKSRKRDTPMQARELLPTEVVQYVQANDASLRRLKRSFVEASALRVLRRAIDRHNAQRSVVKIDESSDDEPSGPLVEHRDTNTMNRSIMAGWAAATPADGADTPVDGADTPADAAATPADTEAELAPSPVVAARASALRASKKRERGSGRDNANKRAKDHKDKDDRAPPSHVRLADLGGVDDIVAEMLELIGMPILHPEVYLHTGIQPPRGVLLHGPPGCGKTMLANAIAAELGVPFISLSAPSIVSGMSGESEKRVREIFDEARSLAPCLMFFDEIDAITPKRESAQREMERRIVAQLLTCMDSLSLDQTDGKAVMIIGATNRPDSLDTALRRAGRFDREIQMTVPDEIAREKILRVQARKLRLSGDFDFRALAKQTSGYVGADLNALTAAAGVAAIKRIFRTLRDAPAAARPEAAAAAPAPLPISADAMDVDDVVPAAADAVAQRAVAQHEEARRENSVIQTFLRNFPDTLTPEQLEPLSITLQDFQTALPQVQPSSKREGFATIPDVTWESVGALERIRIELQMAIVQPIQQPELYEQVGITAPAGVLLWGPPGCGKTLLAKAVANESRANFISVRGPELLNKYVGESERAVRQVFLRARASQPCVIFFDELDALVPRRDDSKSESSTRVVNTLLTELDGLNDRRGIYVIAATNRPDIIDPAMLRPGRLDKPLYVELPTDDERFEILKTVTKSTPMDGSVDLGTIARDERARNFSGADLAALAREAAVAALRDAVLANIQNAPRDGPPPPPIQRQIHVGAADFDRAFSNVKPSVSDRDRAKYERLSKSFAWGDK